MLGLPCRFANTATTTKKFCYNIFIIIIVAKEHTLIHKKFLFLPDIDECVLRMDNCRNNSQCNNTVGSFVCSCNQGYSGNGANCESKLKTKLAIQLTRKFKNLPKINKNNDAKFNFSLIYLLSFDIIYEWRLIVQYNVNKEDKFYFGRSMRNIKIFSLVVHAKYSP